MKQKPDFDIPLLSGFGKVGGRHKDIPAVSYYALCMKSSAFGTDSR
jgi:hypothetical protein